MQSEVVPASSHFPVLEGEMTLLSDYTLTISCNVSYYRSYLDHNYSYYDLFSKKPPRSMEGNSQSLSIKYFYISILATDIAQND